MTPSIVQVEF